MAYRIMLLDPNFPCLAYVKVAKNQKDVYNLLFLQKKIECKTVRIFCPER